MESGGGSREQPSERDELEELLREELAPDLQFVRKLGHSSKSSVYLAREPELKRLVAVKVLSPQLAQDDRARSRFEREAQTIASLSHSNIVAIHRVGRLSNGLPYIVMQFVKGRTLDERLRAEGKFEVGEGRRIVGEVASALAAAHQKGIVHRDVRPANVLYEEETGRTLLTDFGIAAIMARGDSEAPTRLTRTGELVGDPAYMSPEQLMGDQLSERSDVYSLGLFGYELLAGRGPYDASSRRELLTAHIKDRPRKLAELRSDVDLELAELLERCLAKEPGHRPNARDLARRLTEPSLDSTPAPAAAVGSSGDMVSALRERRVVQLSILYGAIAWGVLEVVGLLVERGILPEVGFRLVLVSVLTGLPALLLGAWFHGKKGRQEFTPVEYWLFGGLALIWLAVSAVILLGWLS